MINILDATDIAICKLLLGDAKMTMKVLGKQIFLSTSATRKRKNHLEACGHIALHYSISETVKLEKYVLMHYQIKLIVNSGDHIKRFMDRSVENPQIVNCQYVAADHYDFIVTIKTANLIENNQIAFELCQDFDIYSLSNDVVLSETKGLNLLKL